jgi:uncharacterized membrane protein YfcA
LTTVPESLQAVEQLIQPSQGIELSRRVNVSVDLLSGRDVRVAEDDLRVRGGTLRYFSSDAVVCRRACTRIWRMPLSWQMRTKERTRLRGSTGGIYGIGGGSILAPILIGTGRPLREVAPAALASTFVTSVAGVVTFLILSVHHHGSVAPNWPTGIALGIGGLAGAYAGARIQQRLPDTLIRRVMGILVVAIGARYLWSGLG